MLIYRMLSSNLSRGSYMYIVNFFKKLLTALYVFALRNPMCAEVNISQTSYIYAGLSDRLLTFHELNSTRTHVQCQRRVCKCLRLFEGQSVSYIQPIMLHTVLGSLSRTFFWGEVIPEALYIPTNLVCFKQCFMSV